MNFVRPTLLSESIACTLALGGSTIADFEKNGCLVLGEVPSTVTVAAALAETHSSSCK